MTGRDAGAQVAFSLTAAEVAIIDQGSRTYILGVYAYMALGFATIGFAALATDRLMIVLLMGELRWLLVLACLGAAAVIVVCGERKRAAAARFLGCSALLGICLQALVAAAADATIVPAAFAGAAGFAALSAWGHATRRDLSGPAAFVVMGLAGTLMAGLAAVMLAGSIGHPAVPVASVAILAGFTASISRRLKSEYVQDVAGGVTEQPAVSGALSLCREIAKAALPLPRLSRRRRRNPRPPASGRPVGL